MAFPVLASGTHAAPGSAGGFVERSSWLEPETMALMHLDLTTLLLSSHLCLPGEGTQRQRGHTVEQPWALGSTQCWVDSAHT